MENCEVWRKAGKETCFRFHFYLDLKQTCILLFFQIVLQMSEAFFPKCKLLKLVGLRSFKYCLFKSMYLDIANISKFRQVVDLSGEIANIWTIFNSHINYQFSYQCSYKFSYQSYFNFHINVRVNFHINLISIFISIY